MSKVSPLSYECTFLAGGTGSASDHLTPMFSAWADAQGYTVHPGTLNLCASDPIQVPAAFHSLTPYGQLVSPPWRRFQNGFSPRLYDVVLNGSEAAWLYRWSSADFLRCFVGHADDCPPEHRAELVSPKHLTTALGLTPGDMVTLEFG